MNQPELKYANVAHGYLVKVVVTYWYSMYCTQGQRLNKRYIPHSVRISLYKIIIRPIVTVVPYHGP